MFRRLWRFPGNSDATSGQPFSKQRIYTLLTNPLYMGKVRIGNNLWDGEHEAIIDEGTFEQVRNVLKRNRTNGGVQVRNRHGALLKGLLFDAQSGYALSHTFSKKGNKLYRYYVNLQANKEGKAATSLPAAEIETFVVEPIHPRLHDSDYGAAQFGDEYSGGNPEPTQDRQR